MKVFLRQKPCTIPAAIIGVGNNVAALSNIIHFVSRALTAPVPHRGHSLDESSVTFCQEVRDVRSFPGWEVSEGIHAVSSRRPQSAHAPRVQDWLLTADALFNVQVTHKWATVSRQATRFTTDSHSVENFFLAGRWSVLMFIANCSRPVPAHFLHNVRRRN